MFGPSDPNITNSVVSSGFGMLVEATEDTSTIVVCFNKTYDYQIIFTNVFSN